MTNPCYNCPKRAYACHVGCDEGEAWDLYNKERKVRIYTAKHAEGISIDSNVKSYERATRKKQGRR